MDDRPNLNCPECSEPLIPAEGRAVTDLLDCPACGEPCAEIPPCSDCLPDNDPSDGPWWCERRSGTCACGAQLYVYIDEDGARLEEREDGSMDPQEGS